MSRGDTRLPNLRASSISSYSSATHTMSWKNSWNCNISLQFHEMFRLINAIIVDHISKKPLKSAILLKHTFCQSKINVVLWYFPHFFAQYATHWKTRRGGSRLVRNRAKWSRTCPWSSTLQIHEFFLNGSLLAMNDRNYKV